MGAAVSAIFARRKADVKSWWNILDVL